MSLTFNSSFADDPIIQFTVVYIRSRTYVSTSLGARLINFHRTSSYRFLLSVVFLFRTPVSVLGPSESRDERVYFADRSRLLLQKCPSGSNRVSFGISCSILEKFARNGPPRTPTMVIAKVNISRTKS